MYRTTLLSTNDPDLEVKVRYLVMNSPGKYFVPLIFGSMLDTILCGVMLVQAYLWRSRKQDGRILRWIVRWCVVAESAHTVYVLWSILELFGTRYGTYAQFANHKYFVWNVPFFTFILPPIQLFYAERAYRLNGNNKWIFMSIIPLILATCGGLIAALTFHLLRTSDVESPLETAFTALFYSAIMASDLVVTVSMLAGLYNLRKRGGIEADHLIKKLYVVTVESQLPSTLVAVATIALAYLVPASFFNVGVSMVYPKLYVVTFLAVLLGRRGIKEKYTTAPVHRLVQHGVRTEERKFGVDNDPAFIEENAATITRKGYSLSSPQPDGQLEILHLNYTMGQSSLGSAVAVHNMSVDSKGEP